MHQPGQYEYKVVWDNHQSVITDLLNELSLQGWQVAKCAADPAVMRTYAHDSPEYVESGLWVIMQRVRIDEPEEEAA